MGRYYFFQHSLFRAPLKSQKRNIFNTIYEFFELFITNAKRAVRNSILNISSSTYLRRFQTHKP